MLRQLRTWCLDACQCSMHTGFEMPALPQASVLFLKGARSYRRLAVTEWILRDMHIACCLCYL